MLGARGAGQLGLKGWGRFGLGPCGHRWWLSLAFAGLSLLVSNRDAVMSPAARRRAAQGQIRWAAGAL